VLLITAVVLVVLLGIAALAIDVPIAMAERRDAQNAADHAALSAAWAHCAGDSPTAAATDSVVSNGYQTLQLTLTNPGSGQYQASVASSSGAFFSRIFGVTDIAVGTSSVAECTTGSGSGNAVFAFGDDCEDGKWGVQFPGNNHTIVGGVRTNDQFDISGNDSVFSNGSVTYANSGGNRSDTNTYEDPLSPFLDAPYQENPLAHLDAEYYKSIAFKNSTGKIESGDITQDGIYYTTSDIVLDNVGSIDNPLKVTLVAEGQIILNNNVYIEPYVDGVLADRCSKYGVTMNGNDSDWFGLIYAPGSGIEFSGNDGKTLFG
jgi:hypothetical protein